MRKRKLAAFVAIPAAVALALAGCSGGGGSNNATPQQSCKPAPSGSSTASSASASSGGSTSAAAGSQSSTSSQTSNPPAENVTGSVTSYETEPQNDLTPGNTDEQGGIRAVDELYAGLIKFDSITAKPYNLMADSITTSDSKVYDIKIKKGWKFHDGTEVKAHNFVDAWNYTSYCVNAQINAPFFSQIQGYSDVNPDGSNAQAKASTMSGLKVLGDYEFQVTLAAPFPFFTTKIGYEGFYPLPDAFFKDPKAFAQKPIGNGPMKFVSFTPNQDIKLTRFDDYQGQDAVHFRDLDFKIYSSLDTAYKDLVAGNLDFLDLMPPAALANNKYKTELQGRVLNPDLLDIDMIAVPYYVSEYNNPDLRKAISLAIDRDSILKNVLNGAYSPAHSYATPLLDGNSPDSCPFCKFDPAQAKQYFAKSGFKGSKLTIASNSDGGHKEALTAVCGSITNVLGVQCDFLPQTSLGEFRAMVTSRQATGMTRLDWSADYPSIDDFLDPLYMTDGASNDSKYSNPQVDKLLAQGDSAPSKDEAIKSYQQAAVLIGNDLPNIALWNEKGSAGYSSHLATAKLDFRRQPDISSFRLAK